MYLKRLEMLGFKSFAKKADLNFNNNITIVVGPNGSGKSNIVDAIRWVLGEGSAKSLRGSKMEDVIFSGSVDKKPLGMAQVSLTLDNSAGIFPIDYTEIKITRKLYRSGESEYLINNNRCRQKDIHELIMDTGIGRDSFAIIGQGKVDQILLSQADEKRALIEEVAGISKYRYRKNEAKRKLSDTENSLLRVKDIVNELEFQKEPLREQAEKAAEYKDYKIELDTFEINLAKFTINNLHNKSDVLIKEKEELKKDNLARETSILKGESFIEELSFEIENTSREASDIQNKIYEINNLINDFNNKSEFSVKMLETLKENEGKIVNDKNKVTSEYEETLVKRKDESEEFKKIMEEFIKISSAFKIEEEKIDNIKNSESGFGLKIQEIREELFGFAHQISEVHNRIIDLEKREAVLSSGSEGITSKIQKNQDAMVEKEKEILSIQENLNKVIKDEEQVVFSMEEEEKVKGIFLKKKDVLKEEIEKMMQEVERKSVNKQALEALENNKEGYSAGVKSIFANNELKGILGTIADLAETEGKYRLAIETALGASIQNIVTEHEEYAKIAINYLRDKKAGRATFLPLNIIGKRTSGFRLSPKPGLRNALEVVTYQEKYKPIFIHLLGNIYIAENMDEAIKFNNSQDKPVRIVTLQGEIIDPRGAMTGGQYRNNQEGFLLRKGKIKELEAEISKLEKDSADKGIKLVENEKNIGKSEEKNIFLKEEAAKIEKKKMELENTLLQITFQISEAEKDINMLQSEKNEIHEELQEVEEEKLKNKNNLLMQDNKKKELEETLLKLQEDSEKEKSSLFDLEKTLSKMEITFNDIKNKKENKETILEEIKKREISLKERSSELEQEEIEILEKIKELNNNHSNYGDKLKESEILLYDLEKAAEEKRTHKLSSEGRKKQMEDEVKKNRRIFDELKDKVHGQELLLEKYKTEADSVKESLQERFKIEYERSFEEFAQEFSERNSKQRVRELRNKIENLGEVNLIAISEYDKLLERYTFLKTQCADLDEAKDSLLKIIIEMDHIIIKKFKDTFYQLNESFKETFGEMFHGGSAEIIMTDKENVLETGIEIIAQPPGKTARHLSLLSGGEKAMTAICLLFAIIKIKPGPFCILDEIEASLDESNVARFSGFLKKYSQLTQFVVISHRKGTMEAGDVLYGVTMEEKGVSSLISVRISETIKLSS